MCLFVCGVIGYLKCTKRNIFGEVYENVPLWLQVGVNWEHIISNICLIIRNLFNSAVGSYFSCMEGLSVKLALLLQNVILVFKWKEHIEDTCSGIVNSDSH